MRGLGQWEVRTAWLAEAEGWADEACVSGAHHRMSKRDSYERSVVLFTETLAHTRAPRAGGASSFDEVATKSQPRTGHTREPDPTHNELKHTATRKRLTK